MNPSQISHYRVDRLIGVGGMGEVYLAEDPTLRRKVALKLLPARFTQDEERVRRFQREARAASALNHPNIITIYEIGQSDSVHYIATEFIEGETLRQRMTTRKLTLGEVLDVAIGVTSALVAAHDAGIVHRDIKPENIMLRPDGYVKVLDFGLAKLADGGDGFLKDSATGAVMGTLLYISPEQARGFQPDARSDLYSLGTVIYEMLTGSPPITSENFLDLALAIANRIPDPPSLFAAGVPRELDRIALKALEKDPRTRYQNARELLSDLKVLRRELEYENNLTGDLQRRYHASGIGSQPTSIMSFPPNASITANMLTQKLHPLRAIVVTLCVVAIVAVSGFVIVRQRFFAATKIDSIAVLPFVNASGDPSTEYLSDGISESVIDSLSQLPQLQVTARSTTFRYKGKTIDPLAVGRELHTDGVVTGQVMQRGNTLVIRARLTDVRSGNQVWGQQYDRKLSDVVAVQQEMAEEITGQLRMHLSGEEKRLLTKGTSENSEAFQYYLKARHYRQKYDEAAIRKSIAYYNEAIERDPTYALAWAGLADAYYGLSNLYSPPHEAMPRAREAARRALALDDTLAPAHASLAQAMVWYDWDFRGGEREFKRAIALNPNDADARRMYGDFLTATGQFDRAIAEKKRAEELDPLSILASWDVGRTYFYAGRLKEAEEQVRRTIELDEHFAYSYFLLSQIAWRRGDLKLAFDHLAKSISMAGRKPLLITWEAYMHARLGHREEAQKGIDELKERTGSYTLPLLLARIEAGLGDNDAANRYLEQCYTDRSESIVWLKVDPSLETLRDDPAFIAILKKAGLQ
jgi:serine/threonine protein kinase/Tfp pilus assembly protein PilF